MAGNRLAVSTPSEVSTTTSARVILLARAGNGTTGVRIKIDEISISFKGTTQANAPIFVEVIRYTMATAGTAVITATPNRINVMSATGANNDTFFSTGFADYSAAPTAASATDSVVMTEQVHPQTGFIWQARFGGEIHVPPNQALAIRVTATVSVACNARIVYEE